MARAAVGVAFLAGAGALASRKSRGEIALWPAATVPTWFGVSHLVAAVTGYQGCPELGAIPSLILDHAVGTHCTAWDLVDVLLHARARDGERRHPLGETGGAGSI